MKHLYGILFLISFNASAQINPGARFTAMAGTGVSLQDVWSIQQNQAGLAGMKKISIAVAYEKPFAGYELSTQSAILVLPLNKNVFGISFQRYGFSSYTEQRTAFTYARSFGNKLYAAMNFNHHLMKIEAYGTVQTYSVEAGLQYHPSEKVSIAAHVANPTRNGQASELILAIPARLQVGASYLISEKVLLAMAVEQGLNAQMDTKLGLEYKVIELLALRGGISANPFKHYAGFGIRYHKLKMDIAASSQPVLGYSPQIALSYEF